MQKVQTDPKSHLADEKAQKFSKCFLTKIGFINANGDVQDAVIIEKLSKDQDKAKVEALLKECKTAMGTNKDEGPLKLYACYVEKKNAKAN